MKTFLVAAVALSTLSGFALASEGRNYDLRESDTYIGKFATPSLTSTHVEAISVIQTGKSNSTDREVRRLDEKN